MKKLLFFLPLITLNSCFNVNHNHTFVVEEIRSDEDLLPGLCIYQIQSYNIMQFDLIDSVGKFNINDTLTLTK